MLTNLKIILIGIFSDKSVRFYEDPLAFIKSQVESHKTRLPNDTSLSRCETDLKSYCVRDSMCETDLKSYCVRDSRCETDLKSYCVRDSKCETDLKSYNVRDSRCEIDLKSYCVRDSRCGNDLKSNCARDRLSEVGTGKVREQVISL